MNRAVLWLSLVIAAVTTLEFLARLDVERNKVRFFLLANVAGFEALRGEPVPRT